MQKSHFRSGLSAFLALTLCLPAVTGLVGCGGKEDLGSPKIPQAAAKTGTAPAGATIQPEPSTGQSAAAPKAGSEVAEVRQMLAEASKSNSLSAQSEYLRNEFAAMLGVIMLIPIGMAIDMGASMSNMMPKDATHASTPAPKTEELKAMKVELDALMKKYHLENAGKPSDQAVKELNSQGRAMLKEIDAFATKLQKSGNAKGSDIKPRSDFPKDLDKYTYTVASPTVVKIAPPQGSKEKPVEAHFEDGKWRLHFGGLDDLKKMEKTAPIPQKP